MRLSAPQRDAAEFVVRFFFLHFANYHFADKNILFKVATVNVHVFQCVLKRIATANAEFSLPLVSAALRAMTCRTEVYSSAIITFLHFSAPLNSVRHSHRFCGSSFLVYLIFSTAFLFVFRTGKPNRWELLLYSFIYYIT